MSEIDKIKALGKKLEEIGIFDLRIDDKQTMFIEEKDLIDPSEDKSYYQIFSRSGYLVFCMKKEAYEKLGEEE